MEKAIEYTTTSTAEKSLLCDKYNEINAVRTMPFENPIRPSHYGGDGNVYEVFNVLEAWGLDKDFYLGNVVKYVARAGKKNKSKEKEDLEKALVYLQKRIDSL
jgi:hypothetical protein